MNIKASLSQARFARYLRSAAGNEDAALELYEWNTLTAQSLYVYLQSWEVTYRNKLDSFLRWKYGHDWPYDEKRLARNLSHDEKRRLGETRERQSRQRGLKKVPTDAFVADLSAGFWVALLSKSYEVPFVWRHNLARVFPNDQALTRIQAHEISTDILTLRNRIAHHEPIYDLALSKTYNDMQRLVAAMCKDTDQFARKNCTFLTIAKRRPAFLTKPF